MRWQRQGRGAAQIGIGEGVRGIVGVSWEEWVSRVSGVGVILGQRVGRPDWPRGHLGRGPARGGAIISSLSFSFCNYLQLLIWIGETSGLLKWKVCTLRKLMFILGWGLKNN